MLNFPQLSLNKGALALAVVSFAACSTQPAAAPNEWRNECVGRMQMALPEAADMPTTPPKYLASYFGLQSAVKTQRFEFLDGQGGGHTDFGYRGKPMISPPLGSKELSALLLAHGTHRKEQARRDYAARVAPGGGRYTLTSVDLDTPDASAWQFYGSRFDLAVRYGDHLLTTVVDTGTSDLSSSRQTLKALARSVRPRSIFDIPQAAGVCLPHTFIEDDGQRPRSIGVTYRLKAHPDVSIWLEDSTAQSTIANTGSATTQGAKDADRFSPEYKSHFFWSQDYQSPKAWRHLWPDLHEVRLDGRKGVASFVELKRQDNTLDYGYLAVVRGDPESLQDSPDLMLYVIRDAKNAIEKGKQPIEKDELLRMAEAIAASVKRRPTN
jgi:hypothetical protein